MKYIFLLIISALFFSCKKEDTKVTNSDSTHFKFLIADTLTSGNNLARISEYNRELKENEETFIAVIIKNELEDGTTKIDTFSDGLKTPFFGISRYRVGEQKIQIKVEEKMVKTKELTNDSTMTEIKDIYYSYEFDVYVEEAGYKSELNDFLRKEMDKAYAEDPI